MEIYYGKTWFSKHWSLKVIYNLVCFDIYWIMHLFSGISFAAIYFYFICFCWIFHPYSYHHIVTTWSIHYFFISLFTCFYSITILTNAKFYHMTYNLFLFCFSPCTFLYNIPVPHVAYTCSTCSIYLFHFQHDWIECFWFHMLYLF